MSFNTNKRTQHRDWNLFLRKRQRPFTAPIDPFPWMVAGNVAPNYYNPDTPPDTAFTDNNAFWTLVGSTSIRFLGTNGTVWLCVANINKFIFSTLDGVTWTGVAGSANQLIDGANDPQFNGVFAVGVYVAVGTIAAGNNGIWSSPTGQTWTKRVAANYKNVHYGNGKFWVNLWATNTAAAITESVDGITWANPGRTVTGIYPNPTCRAVFTYKGALLVSGVTNAHPVTGEINIMWRSVDGGLTLDPVAPFTVGEAGAGGYKFAASATTCICFGIFSNSILYKSADGITWVRQSIGVVGVGQLIDIIYKNGLFVLLYDRGEYRISADDGITWDGPYTSMALGGGVATLQIR